MNVFFKENVVIMLLPVLFWGVCLSIDLKMNITNAYDQIFS